MLDMLLSAQMQSDGSKVAETSPAGPLRALRVGREKKWFACSKVRYFKPKIDFLAHTPDAPPPDFVCKNYLQLIVYK